MVRDPLSVLVQVSVDFDGNGRIDFEEFATAATPVQPTLVP